MRKNLLSNKGIRLGGVVAITAVLIVLAAFTYHRHRQADVVASYSSNSGQAAQSQSARTADVAPIKPFSAIQTAQDATSFVQATYDEYLAAIDQASTHDGIPPNLAALTAVKNDVTSDLYTEATASPNGAAFSCAADYVPDKYTASSAASGTTSDAVPVQVSKSADGAATSGMTVTVDLYSLKISAVNCR